MKLPLLLIAGALFAATNIGHAAEQPAAPAPAKNDVEAEIEPIVTKLRGKLQAGERSEAAIAEELKALDALIERHKSEKDEPVAQASMLRAMVYLQVLQDYEKATTLLTAVQHDFTGTEAAKIAGAYLEKLESQKESLKIQSSLKPGAAFPDFDAKDVAGAPLSIGKYKGKVVLVDFWATWCGPCVAELPNVIAAYSKYHDKGFEIVGISLDETEDKLKKFVAEKKMPWQQYFDGKGWESDLGRKYGVNSIPATYLLDRDGKIVAKDLRGPALEKQLEQLLAQ